MSAWDAKRTEELRRLARKRTDAEFPAERAQARERFNREAPDAVLSLLDELESVHRERDEANEALTIAYMLGSQGAREEAAADAKAMRDEIICLRAELAEYSEEFGP